MYLLGALVLWVLVLIYYSIPAVDPSRCIPFEEYRDKIRTGDIIVLHNGGLVSTLIKLYEQSPATHTGIAIVENGELYICELDYHSYFSYDVHVSKFDEFMQKQWPIIGIIPVKKELPLTVEEAKQIPCKFDLTFGVVPLPGRIYCSTLVHRLHRKYGLLPWNGACEHKTTPRIYHHDPSIIMLEYKS